MTSKALAPVHPGEILREEFLAPLDMSPYALAAALHVPRTRVERLIREETAVIWLMRNSGMAASTSERKLH